MTTTYLCECKHAKGVHQGMTYWCREDGCACKRYTPDFAAPMAPLAVAGQAIAATAQKFGEAYEAGDSVLGESTSARLRRVEQELDAARGSLTELAALYESATAETARVEDERDHWIREYHQAHNELGSARAEGAQRRAERDKAYAANAKLIDEVADTQAAAEEKVRAVLVAAGDAPADLISRLRRYLCETCGARYGINYTDHAHGPLTPVVVTITRSAAAAATPESCSPSCCSCRTPSPGTAGPPGGSDAVAERAPVDHPLNCRCKECRE